MLPPNFGMFPGWPQQPFQQQPGQPPIPGTAQTTAAGTTSTMPPGTTTPVGTTAGAVGDVASQQAAAASQVICNLVSWSVGPLGRLPDSWSGSQSDKLPIRHLVSQSVSQSFSQSVSQWVSESVSHSFSQLSISQSVSCQ